MTPGHNIAGLIIDAASRNPANIAIRSKHADVSYAVLKSMMVTFALHMQSHGVTRSSRIAIDATAEDLVIAITLAASLLGCCWIQPAPVAFNDERLGITHLFYEQDKKYPAAKNLIRVDKSWLVRPPGLNIHDTVAFAGYASPDAPWMIAHSSGTTGTPKYMVIPVAIPWRVLQAPFPSQVGAVPIMASLFPLTMPAVARRRISVFAQGGTVVTGGDYDFWAECNVNYVNGSPAQFAALFRRHPVPASPAIKVAALAGGLITAIFLRTVLKYFESVRCMYGATESSGVCSKHFTHVDDDKVSLGCPEADCEIHIVDEAGGVLPWGTEGIVKIRNINQVTEYLGDPATSAQIFRDGWFYPGDIGYLSEAGELYITGRTDDILNIGGSKINAARIDEIIQATPGVIDGICFVQQASDGLGELAAVVSINDDADANSIAALIRKQLREQVKRAAVPKRIYICENIPRNANGKAVRNDASRAIEGIEPV